MSRKRLPPRISQAQARLYTEWREAFGVGVEHVGTIRTLLSQLPDVHTTRSAVSRQRSASILRQRGFLIRLPDQPALDLLDTVYYAADRAFRVEPPRRHTS